MKKTIILTLLIIIALSSCNVANKYQVVKYRKQSYRYSKCPTNDPIGYFYRRGTGEKYRQKWVAPTRPYKSRR